jgi:4-hydroxy-tetrahydrodipicolinate reductase
LDLPFFASLDEAGSELEGEIDLLIDFTLPEGTLSAAQWCRSHRVALLSGVTGIGTKVQSALDETAKSAPVLWAANFSFGINLMAGLLRELARVTAGSASITIEETHHMDKKDAPSGTALFLARHLSPPAEWETGSDPGRIAEAFPAIEFVSKREGNVVGDHSVSLDLGDETLTLAHHARDRRLYARGALEAGRWLTSQPPGRYSAADWIRGAASSGLSVSNGQG